VLPLPEGSDDLEALWMVEGVDDPSHLRLIRWQVSLTEGTGQLVLLCRAIQALGVVQQVGPGERRGLMCPKGSPAVLCLCAVPPFRCQHPHRQGPSHPTHPPTSSPALP
jgi:hypothetical protein